MNIKVFLISLVFLIIVDFIWLGLIAKGFYATHLAEIGNFKDGQLQVKYWAAIMVYVILVVGINVYALPLAAQSDSMLVAFAYGAGLGFLVYGVYDFTNYATLKSYPLVLLGADLAWGTFVCGVTTCVARYALEKWS